MNLIKYDIAVIGGGPAGMMAAGRAGELGSSVVLLEKNNKLGVKLLLTGGGRCNLTNKVENKKDMVSQLGENGKFLFSALHRFGAEEVMEFFTNRGVPLKIEDNNRVFPESNRASDVLNALIDYLHESKVDILTGSAVKDIVKRGNNIEKIILTNGDEIRADKYIIATGGKSYPETGSSGEGYEWLRMLGHTIINPRPALAPLIMKENFIKDLQGISLPNVSVSVYKQDKKIAEKNGEIIFTADGLSGPAIINISKAIGQALPEKTILKLNFFPQHDSAEMDEKVRRIFLEANNKLLKNSLDGLLPSRLSSMIIKLSNIDSEKQINLVTREERKKLVQLLKEFTLEAKELAGFGKAMVTAGGVALNEVDPQTMKSKIIDNLYFAGEILDLDGPTGGFNLQIAWSTGYTVGMGASAIL